jgi:hypothetical protein
MKNSIQKSVLLLVSAAVLLSFDIPAGWFTAGSKPKSYEMGIDKGAGPDGKNAATIKSVDSKVDGFGTLMQTCKPGKYSGKRVRMSGFVKSENVSAWAGLWLRVDQSGSEQPLSFDNMADRPIKGTTPWTRYEIILDVPDNAARIAFGGLLSGTGQIWFDNMTFEIVSDNVLATGKSPDGPLNLDFER